MNLRCLRDPMMMMMVVVVIISSKIIPQMRASLLLITTAYGRSVFVGSQPRPFPKVAGPSAPRFLGLLTYLRPNDLTHGNKMLHGDQTTEYVKILEDLQRPRRCMANFLIHEC